MELRFTSDLDGGQQPCSEGAVTINASAAHACQTNSQAAMPPLQVYTEEGSSFEPGLYVCGWLKRGPSGGWLPWERMHGLANVEPL